MKVLNRPMFRMGGPIKEGIMDGIKEPMRQGYAEPPGFVIPNDPNKMTVNQLLDNQKNAAAAFTNIFANQKPIAPMKVNTTAPQKNIFSGNIFAPDEDPLGSDFATTVRDKDTGRIVIQPPQGLDPVTKAKIKANLGIINRDEFLDVVKTEELKKKQEAPITTSTTIQDSIPDAEIKPDVSLKTDPPVVTETKKDKVNKILDSLGYKRAQKNALYDAMIKAGQRISRTGLGADNLVSDIIAETSQSYDKPEKLREAAELMQAQQDLKLEQIEASKDTRSPIQKTAEYYLESGVAKNMDDAIRMARNLPVTVSETFQTKVKEFGKSGGLDQTAIDLTERGQFGNLEFKNKINKKYKGKPLSEFLKSEGFKGDGVYTADGKILVIENGEIKQTIVVRGSIEDSIFNFGGGD